MPTKQERIQTNLDHRENEVADYEFSLEVLEKSLQLAQQANDPALAEMISNLQQNIGDTKREMAKAKISRDAMRAIKAGTPNNP